MLFTSWVGGVGWWGGGGSGNVGKSSRLPCSQQFFANFCAEKMGFLRGGGGGGETDCPQYSREKPSRFINKRGEKSMCVFGRES